MFHCHDVAGDDAASGGGAPEQFEQTQLKKAIEEALELEAVEADRKAGRGVVLLGEPAPIPTTPVQVAAAPSAGASPGVLVAADRRMVLRLRKGEELLGEKRYAEAAELLQLILDADEDGFYHPDPDKTETYRSLKSAAVESIGKIPAAERKAAYESPYGGEARRMLSEAAKAADFAGIAAVSRRYFHTQAGYEATWQLGARRFDRGDFLAAALAFERLRGVPEAKGPREPHLSLRTAICWARVGMAERARAALDELPIGDAASFSVGGREIPSFAPADDKPAWLARHFGGPGGTRERGGGDWPVFRGDAARNGVATLAPAKEGEAPIDWRRSIVVDPEKDPGDAGESETEARLRRMVAAASGNDGGTRRGDIPAGQPLIVGDLVVARTLGTVRAMRLDTGTTIWETMVDATLQETILGQNAMQEMPASSRDVLLARLIEQRLWEDAAHGALSGDGERMYAIEAGGFATPFVITTQNGAAGRLVMPASFNRLVALDVASGFQVWDIGGAPVDEYDYVRPLAGTYFLGPPLPLAGGLYGLAERDREVRLLVLDPRTGSVVWEQPLAGADVDIASAPQRRTAGTSPSYADGVLVCPTGTGGLVALDLDTRSLLWAYQVEATGTPPAQPGPFPRPRPVPPAGNAPAWREPVPVIAEGCVLFVPPAGDALHCVGLLDGVPRWKRPRGDAVAIAGVSDGRVLLVGTAGVQGVKLADGSAAWEKPAAVGKPAGRGFLADGKLHVPLASGKLAALDARTGRVLETTELPQGVEPGNLLGARGTIVSQGPAGIAAIPAP
ncbi:MAG: PQQ-binding-like beta-propeller repeat protein [Planctomycetales bacterium]